MGFDKLFEFHVIYIMNFYELDELLEAKKVIPIGDCFKFATKLAVEMLSDGIIPENKILVVHGLVHPNWHHREYWHAWVETDWRGEKKCLDWQMRISRKGNLPLPEFYEMYHPKNIIKYKPAEAVGMAIKHSHAGPWH